VATLLRKAIQ